MSLKYTDLNFTFVAGAGDFRTRNASQKPVHAKLKCVIFKEVLN